MNKLKLIKLEAGYYSRDKVKEITDVVEKLKSINNEMPIFEKLVHPNGRRVKISQVINDCDLWMNLDRYHQDLMIMDLNNVIKEVNQLIEQFQEDTNVEH